MKRIIAALLAIILGFFLAACGKQNSTQAEKPEQAVQEQTAQTSNDKEKVIETLKDQIGIRGALDGTTYTTFSITAWNVSEDKWSAEGYVKDPSTGEMKPFKSSGEVDNGSLLYSPIDLIIES